MFKNSVDTIVFAMVFCSFLVAQATQADGGPQVDQHPSEWGPIGLRPLIGGTGDGLSGGLGVDIYLGLPNPQTLRGRGASASQDSERPELADRRFGHSLELDLGHATIETDHKDFIRIADQPRELGVFFLTAGYKLRRNFRLEKLSVDTPDESWRELRLVGGLGLGAYSFEGTDRFGTYAKLAGQFAFARHASQAIELGVTVHRPSSAPSFHEIKLGYAWHLPSR